MSDIPNIIAMRGGQKVSAVNFMGQEAEFVLSSGKMVFQRVKHFSLMDFTFLPQSRLTEDDVGVWFEFGFVADGPLTGNAAAGWVDGGGNISISLESSNDLATWHLARFTDCAETGIANGDGTFTYWSRNLTPNFYKETVCDFSVTFNRYGKSITGLNLLGVDITLPHASYDKTQTALLAADLVALGYSGATVAVTSGQVVASIENYVWENSKVLRVTQSGNNVTNVSSIAGVTIPLPYYPYTLPAQAGNLRDDLVSAGYSGAVVKLLGDVWVINIPNINCVDNQRFLTATFDPGDSYPYWDEFGVFQGYNPDSTADGTFSNVRNISGNPMTENLAGNFARLRISPLRTSP